MEHNQNAQTLERLFRFLQAGVTPWHAVAEAAAWLGWPVVQLTPPG